MQEESGRTYGGITVAGNDTHLSVRGEEGGETGGGSVR